MAMMTIPIFANITTARRLKTRPRRLNGDGIDSVIPFDFRYDPLAETDLIKNLPT
jgi:hypothetical protein